MTTHVRTTLDIDAPREKVWDVLADFDSYNEWNPFIRDIRAKMEAGADVDFKADAGKGRPVKIQARMLRASRPTGFCWRGPRSAVLGAIFNGEHYFELERIDDDHTRLIHGEYFGGAIPRVAPRWLTRTMVPIYDRVNAALKKRVEEG